MKIVMTGATGFTGQFVLDLLCEAGHEVRCLVRPSSKTEILLHKKCTTVSGDLEQADSLLEAFKGAEALVNVASLGFGHAPGILAACKANGIKRGIFFSTTGIFTQLNPQSKQIRLAAEAAIKESGIQYTILRPTMIYGTHADRNMARLVKFLAKWPVIPVIGPGTYLQQPVYVKDLAKSVVLALENPKSINREYNVPGKQELTYNEVIDTASRLLNRRVRKMHVPLKICTGMLWCYEKVSRKPRFKVEQALRLNENKNFSMQEIQSDLGYSPLSFEEGIKREIEEMRAMKLI